MIQLLTRSAFIATQKVLDLVAFCYGGPAEQLLQQAVVSEEQMGQPRTFLTYRDSSDLAQVCSMLKKSVEAFCTKKKQVRGKWVPLPDTSGWMDD